MKKFFGILLSLFIFTNCALAQNEVNFIYINGSNTNTQKSKDWFYNGVAKFHPKLKTQLEYSDFFQTKMLNSGKYKISSNPAYLFWGDMSKNELEVLKEDIGILSGISPRVAQFVREFIADCFHDAIWISKFQNMMPVLDLLHAQIQENHKRGDKVVLMGYSAGTFVNYQYFLTRMPVIDIDTMVENLEISTKTEIKETFEYKDTCLDALFRAEILTYNMIGRLVANSNKMDLDKNLSKIDEYTKNYCAPDGVILGLVNYASPIPLFYSEFLSESYKISDIKTLLGKYLIENNMFYLTVNFADDPLGIPSSKNVTFKQINETIKKDIQPNGGFFYEKSDVASPMPFFGAHTSYWKCAKKFAKAITMAYEQGYKFFYSNEN